MKYKTTQKDRYGNMRSLEIETDGNNLEVPPMGSGIPQYEAVGGLAENHPGDPKGSDTVPAWLTPGEFVVNKEAVDIYGPQIKKMNDVGREIQDGNMNPSEVPPIYADAGVAVPKSKPLRLAFEHQYGSTLEDWKNWLKEREGGFRSDVYSGARDPNVWEPTTGFGHLLPVGDYTFEEYGQGGVQGPFADEAAANKQFEDDFAIALAAAQRNVGTDTWRELQPQQQFALANMAYQMGQTRQAGFDGVLDAIKAKKWKKAGQQAQYNFFANNPDKVHSYTPWANPNTGTPERVEDFQAFIQAFPEEVENVDPSLQQAIEAAQARYKELSAEGSVDGIPSSDNSTSSEAKRKSFWDYFPSFGKSPEEVKKNFYDKKLKKRGMQDGGVVHAFMGQEVPRYLTDLQDDELEAYLNQYVIPGAENLVYRSGAGGGDSDDLGYAPTAMPPIPDVYTESEKIIPPEELVSGDVQEIEDVVEPSVFNPWEYEAGMTYKYPYSYPDVPSTSSASVPNVPVPSGVDHGFQKELDKKILQNVDSFTPNPNLAGDFSPDQRIVDSNVMQNVPKSEDLIGNLYESIDSGQGAIPPYSDLLDTIEIPRAGKHPGYNPIGDPTFTSAYDQMVQDELTGEAAYDIPPLPPTDYNFGEHDTGEIPVMPGEDRREDYRPSGFGPTLMEEEVNPNNAQQAIDYYQGRIDSMLEDVKSLRIAAEAGHSGAKEMLATNTKIIKDYEDKIKEAQRKLQLAEDQKAFMESGWVEDSKARTRLSDLKDSFANALTDSEKNKIKAEIDKTEKKIEDNKVQTDTKENKLENIAITIDEKTEKEIANKLNSKQGKAALENAGNKSNNDPEVSKTRQMFDFLFGDIIDGGEIGRAITVYLASRALGYNHNGSIGFVAKQYLKRVDAKNAQMDKWILANAGKFTPASLAKFKRTRNFKHLIPLGAAPRSAGGRKMFYHKDLGELQGFEFKIKNAAGDDETYWSFDPTGKDPSAKVGSGWTETDPRIIPKESINDIEKIIKGFQESTSGKKVINKGGKNQRTIYYDSGTDTPSLNATAVADEVAGWLYERGIRPGKFKQPIYEALAQAVAENRKLISEGEDAKEIGSLIPWLEEATIKVRLEDMMDSKGRLIPSPVKATVDGKEITMDTKMLVDLQQRIESFYGVQGAAKFWAATADQWGDRISGDKKKTYRDAYVDEVKKALKDKSVGSEYTPFALFAANRIETILRKAAEETAQQ